MIKIFIFLVFIFLTACSGIKPIQRGHTNENVGVDLQIENQKDSKKAEEPQANITKEETIRIGDNGGQVFNQIEPSITDDKIDLKKIRVGLNFGPGLNRAINYVEVLKELEKNNIKLNVITGNEMGAVVAALYASGNTPEIIEWMFFKYFKEHKKSKIYSKEWIQEIDEYFLSKLRAQKIEDTEIKFYLTLYDRKTNKVYYFDKGNLRDLLLLNLRLKENPLVFKDGPEYAGAFQVETFNAKLLSGFGSDFNIAVDGLINKVSMGESNHEFVQVVLAASTRYQSEKKKFDYIINLPISEMPLDISSDTSMFVEKTHESVKKHLISLKKKIQSKLEFINSKSNKE